MYQNILPMFFRSLPCVTNKVFTLFDFDSKKVIRLENQNWIAQTLEFGKSETMKTLRGHKITLIGNKFYICGGIEEPQKDLIQQSPCFQLYGFSNKVTRLASMKSQRQYMATQQIKNSEIYCIGGKGKFVQYKTIEKFSISENRWQDLKVQLNYPRYFPSCCQFGDRYIYIFGQCDSNETIEVLDTTMEYHWIKCDKIVISAKPGSPAEMWG